MGTQVIFGLCDRSILKEILGTSSGLQVDWGICGTDSLIWAATDGAGVGGTARGEGRRWRAETTMTVGWIAERLAMGTRGSLHPLLDRRGKLGGE